MIKRLSYALLALILAVACAGGVAYADEDAAATGPSWSQYGSSWQLLAADGSTLSGWQKVDDSWYYLDPENANLMETGLIEVGGKRYQLGDDGKLVVDSWIELDDGWYLAGADGAFANGWAEKGGSWYWLDPAAGGRMVAGERVIRGKTYVFADDGRLRTSQWIARAGMENYAGRNGALAGSRKDGVIYNTAGFEAHGFTRLGDTLFYVEKDGSLKTGWYEEGGRRYLFDENGAARVGTYVEDGISHHFYEDGHEAPLGQLSRDASKAQLELVEAAKNQPTTAGGYCAAWVTWVFYFGTGGEYGGNADEMYDEWCRYDDFKDLKVGMIVAVPTHPHTEGGREYGHIGVYVGDGLIMHSAGEVYTDNIHDWIAYYGQTSTPKWGWPGDVPLA